MANASIALNRFGLGGRLGEAPPADPRGWLIGQLGRFNPAPQPISQQPPARDLLAMLADVRQGQQERRQERKQDGSALSTAAPMSALGEAGPQAAMAPTKAEANPRAGLYRDLRQAYVSAVGARTEAALTTAAPFIERLVHFWSNHFAVSIDKIVTIGLAGSLEFEAIRPHVLGNFRDMLGAVERHPAMLLYLDQAQSIGPNSQLGQRAARNGRTRGLNENLAREIMELHTLGVRSVYSQADVTEFARALTGWTVGGLGRQPMLQAAQPGFMFAQLLHEPGARTIIGSTYEEGGEAQAQAVLDKLARHPATAKHIATKLARHFASDDPPPALVSRLEQAFLTSGGDLPTVYRSLIEAPEPWDASKAKFRNPWDWGVAALRAAGVQQVQGQAVAGMFDQLGQAVWKPGAPAGWDDVAASWAGPDALLRRVELADRLSGRTGGQIDARALGGQLFPGTLSLSTSTAVQRAESPAQGLALLLASPEMMRR